MKRLDKIIFDLKYLNTCSNEDDIFLGHIDYYENYSRNDILCALMEEDMFLKDVIWNLTYVYIMQEYNGITINLDKLDDCKDTEVMKKLIIK